MEVNRKPFQGVLNIVRFNWNFYLIAGLVLVFAMLFRSYFAAFLQELLILGVLAATFTIVFSLVISYYIYDYSDLYQLKWLGDLNNEKILNINAGFDETSDILRSKSTNSVITICDFYHPEKHTEVSIKRARRAYPPSEDTISVETNRLPFPDNTFDKSIAMLSAHEIRDEAERIQFFKELNRITKPSGRIYVTEHLRDWNNFLAYTIGFLHFHSKKTWLKTFASAQLTIHQKIKTTPFITTFELKL
jgi:ubiquinone/menaquinone biosynthesis C-methylase UbiE